jgi:hypothetical protein
MARLGLMEWLPAEEREAASRFACQTLDSLRQVASGETDPCSDPAAMACMLMTGEIVSRAPGGCMSEPLRTWLASVRQKLLNWLESGPDPTPMQAAMVLAALGQPAEAQLRPIAWVPASPERTVIASPWLLDRGMPDAPAAWKATLTQLASAQIDAAHEDDSCADLDGGWSNGGGPPRPNALSARAALALATATRRPDVLAAEDRATALRTLRRAMRFLLQLQADANACHAFRDPTKAMGGLRTAPWDTDQPIAASSYALLAAMQAAEALPEAGDRPQH